MIYVRCSCGKAIVRSCTRCPACDGLILTGDALASAMLMVMDAKPDRCEPIANIIRRVCLKYGVPAPK